MPEQYLERSFEAPELVLRCDCGWVGADTDVAEWVVESRRDRVVRECPSCGEPVPEWGALRSIHGVAQVAYGPLAEAIAEADVERTESERTDLDQLLR